MNNIYFNAFKHKVFIEISFSSNSFDLNRILNSDKIYVIVSNTDNSVVENVELMLDGSVLKGECWLNANELHKFKPESKKLLFEPTQFETNINEFNCNLNKIKFQSTVGKFLYGNFMNIDYEVVDDIKLIVKNRLTNQTLYDTQINSNDGYLLGPFREELIDILDIELNKSGFIIKHLNKNFNENNDVINEYELKKLSELRVHVNIIDANENNLNTNAKLDNILVSLSSSNKKYRKTIKTDQYGNAYFENLENDLYYLLFMMQEYEFETNSQTIQIDNGAQLDINVNAKRIAFSCLGKITTINGQPEPNVFIEAIGINKCKNSQENAESDQQTGIYRIRGLIPGCKYQIRLIQQKTNEKYMRIIPEKYEIEIINQDIYEKNFILIENLEQCDASLYVNAIKNTNFYLPNRNLNNYIRVKLYKLNQPDIFIQTNTIASNTILYFNRLQRDKNQLYGIQVELLLSTTNTNYQQQSSIIDKYELQFQCDQLFKHLNVTFKLDTDKRGNLNIAAYYNQLTQYQNSYFTLPLLLLLSTIIYFKFKQINEFIKFIKNKYLDRNSNLISVFNKKLNVNSSVNTSILNQNNKKIKQQQQQSNKNAPASSSESETRADTPPSKYDSNSAAQNSDYEINNSLDGNLALNKRSRTVRRAN